jgi:hypothetical protein
MQSDNVEQTDDHCPRYHDRSCDEKCNRSVSIDEMKGVMQDEEAEVAKGRQL